MTTPTTVPENVFTFTQSLRMRIANQLLPENDIASQDTKITAIGVKVLRDMDSTEVSVKRLALDNKIAGDNTQVAREIIRATYDNIANGVTPYRTTTPPPPTDEPKFDMPDDLCPEFTPTEAIATVGVADRTYEEIMGSAPPKPVIP